MALLRKKAKREDDISILLLSGAINDLNDAIDKLEAVRDKAHELREEYLAQRIGGVDEPTERGGAGTS